MIVTKIFFRYLLLHLLRPFFLCMAVFILIWILADLYNNLEDFITKKPNFSLMFRFYALQLPKMLVVTLPAAMLFSTLAAILSLNRRSELIALQSAGIPPWRLYSPFLVLAALMSLVLAIDLSGPAATAEVTRERLLKQVKGQSAKANLYENLIFVDQSNRRVWLLQKLDAISGQAEGLELTLRDLNRRATKKYFARRAAWNGEFWRLTGVLVFEYLPDGSRRGQKSFEEVDLTELDTPPRDMVLILAQPDRLTLAQLSQYISTSTQTPEFLANYRTEWWYRVIYPFTILIFVLFALLQGGRTDRRSTATGLLGAIGVLISYLIILNFFLAAGRFSRLPPLVAVAITPIAYGALALHLLAIKHGWYGVVRLQLRRGRAFLRDEPGLAPR